MASIYDFMRVVINPYVAHVLVTNQRHVRTLHERLYAYTYDNLEPTIFFGFFPLNCENGTINQRT
jgi:hypothetical protein